MGDPPPYFMDRPHRKSTHLMSWDAITHTCDFPGAACDFTGVEVACGWFLSPSPFPPVIPPLTPALATSGAGALFATSPLLSGELETV